MNAPFHPRAGTRDPFSAFLSDQNSEDAARAAAAAFGWPLERIHNGGVRYAVQSLAVSPSPSVLLVDLSDSSDPLEDVNGLAEVCEPGTLVIACGTTNDVRFYRDLVAHGIHDYLLKPFSDDQLRAVIAEAQEAIAGARALEPINEVPHLLTAVIGARGGVGCSTVAVSTAWLLAEEKKRSTALLDLDVHFGTGALALDLEPGRGLTDAIENPGRIDGLFIERALVRANERLGVLSAEAPISQPLTGDGQAFYQLEDELRGTCACTVVDLPRHMLVQHPSLLQNVATTIVVTELTLAATRDTIRLLSWLKANTPSSRVILVANKVPGGGEEIARKDFESSVEHAIDLVLPYDLKLASQAAKLGKPIAEVGRASKVGQSLGRLADMITGDEEATTKKSGGGSLFSRLKDIRLKPAKKAA